MGEARLEYMDVDVLRLDPENPKGHDFETLRASYRRFGFTEPPLLNESSGLVSAGNGRIELLRVMRTKQERPPKYVLVRDGAWLIPVVRGLSFANRAEAEAYLVASNRTSELGGWNDRIAALLERVRRSGPSLEGTGYTSRELDKILARARARNEPTEPRQIARPDKSRVKPGEVWELGAHRLACGDSRDRGLWERLTGGELAGMVMSDPPYGMGKVKEGVHNDDLRAEKLVEFQVAWWTAVRPSLESTASVYVWGTAPELWRWWYGALVTSELVTFRNEIVWKKDVPSGGVNDPGHRQYPVWTERCLFFALGGQGFGNLNQDRFWEGWEEIRAWLASEAEAAGFDEKRTREITKTNMHSHWFGRSQWCLIAEKQYQRLRDASGGKHFRRPWRELQGEHKQKLRAWNEWRDQDRGYFDNEHEKLADVWEHAYVRGAERHGHATPKPVLLMVRALRSSSRPGGLVLDPFSGTGPVLLAAEQTGRRCYAAELDPIWCEVTIRRWEELSGHKAIRRGAG